MTNLTPRHGAVAAGHEETAKAAISILDAGGNAFDAAISAFLTACVAEPVLASMGGGGFLTARTSDGDVRCVDFFTQTPARKLDERELDFYPIVADFGPATQDFHIGLGSVAVPGAVSGMYHIHDEFCRLPMSEIAKPAIELAAKGVRINAFQAYLLEVIGPIYRATRDSRSLFCRLTDRTTEPEMKREGDVFHIPEFADFLTVLCAEGPRFFYEGEVAQAISGLNGCSIGSEDLLSYRAIDRPPLEVSVRGHHVYLTPPPAIGGALVAHALGVLNECDVTPESSNKAPHFLAMVDAMQRSNQARRDSGIDIDPIAGARALQEALRHPASYKGTTHISVADVDGNLAAVTVSNGEGCGHLIPGTGIMLNNMLGEEDLNAMGFFEWSPNVRLSSMMTPGVMASPNGTWTAFGSGGSNRIRSALTQVIFNLACLNFSLESAVAAPRMHIEGNKLSAEPGLEGLRSTMSPDTPLNVENWPDRNMFFGGAHLVSERDGAIVGGAGDPRRDGVFLSI